MNKVVLVYAIVCGVVGIMPCSFLFLILIEIGMIYHLSTIHKIPFRLGETGLIWACLLPVSFFFKGFVGGIFLWFPGVGWVLKGLIACGFVLALGSFFNWYYANERRKLDPTY